MGTENKPEQRRGKRPTAAFIAWATLFAERRKANPELTPAQFNSDLFESVRNPQNTAKGSK